MKPRARPGKARTSGRAAREMISHSKPLSKNQMKNLKRAKPNSPDPHAGHGGKKANWDLSYESGIEYTKKPMPWKEDQGFSEDGVRKQPKKGH